MDVALAAAAGYPAAMPRRFFQAVRDDVDPVKARRAIPGLLFVGLAIGLLAVEAGPHYRHSKDIAATVLVLSLLLFGIYGAFAWGEPPERSPDRPDGSAAD